VPRKTLTDKLLKSLKPAATDTRDDYWDAIVPGLGVRVTDTGRASFVLMTRYPRNPKNPTRRALGEYGAITLDDARQKARKWLEWIKAGRDPADVEEQQRQAELRKQENIFPAVAERFIRYIHQQKLRTAADMERDLRQVFMVRWKKRAITEIAAADIKTVIREPVDRGAKYRAFKLFALIRRLFSWALGTDDYGLEYNPCSRLKTKDLIGEREARQRSLTDDELRALWRVTHRWEYPYGALYRLLVLTGLRLGEVCGAEWSEFDLTGKTWTIPALRMKKVRGGAKPHLVPITDAMLQVLETLPRFSTGNFLFSHSFGKRPLTPNQFSDPKAKLDRRMLWTLRAMARLRRDDPSTVSLRDWVNHDIRRTVRTNLSGLKIPEEVREAVLAHVRPGIKGVYDQYEYLEEKREALTVWAARLRDVVAPPPPNVVVKLSKARARL
jgi:integrase